MHIVYHIAAILTLDANLKAAVNMNVTGTFALLKLAKNMSKLEVSLIFVNSNYMERLGHVKTNFFHSL